MEQNVVWVDPSYRPHTRIRLSRFGAGHWEYTVDVNTPLCGWVVSENYLSLEAAMRGVDRIMENTGMREVK